MKTLKGFIVGFGILLLGVLLYNILSLGYIRARFFRENETINRFYLGSRVDDFYRDSLYYPDSYRVLDSLIWPEDRYPYPHIYAVDSGVILYYKSGIFPYHGLPKSFQQLTKRDYLLGTHVAFAYAGKPSLLELGHTTRVVSGGYSSSSLQQLLFEKLQECLESYFQDILIDQRSLDRIDEMVGNRAVIGFEKGKITYEVDPVMGEFGRKMVSELVSKLESELPAELQDLLAVGVVRVSLEDRYRDNIFGREIHY